jgi:hypothetical protein
MSFLGLNNDQEKHMHAGGTITLRDGANNILEMKMSKNGQTYGSRYMLITAPLLVSPAHVVIISEAAGQDCLADGSSSSEQGSAISSST